MWEINNSLQLLSFARSLVLGVLVCLCYDILRALRRVLNYSAVTVFFQDVVFSALTAITTFIFLLSVTNGEMRGFVLVGMAVGFLITRMTLSVLLFKFLKLILGKLNNVFSWVFNKSYEAFDRIEKNIQVFLQKSCKTLKKLLKKQGHLLYTKSNREV